MHLQESGEMYLETILVLSKNNPYVRSLDVAIAMNYSKPSVSRAVHLLMEGGYLTADENSHLHLTDEGRTIAEKIYERHQVLSQCLTLIGVDESTAAEDACRIEHIISDETFRALKEHLKRYQ